MSNSGNITLEDVMNLVQHLTPVAKVRLIERLAPDIERALATQPRRPSRSLLGLVRDLGTAPSASEIDDIRKEMWASLQSDDI